MSKLLSIIIPTYNMETYLRRCLDSLLIKDNFSLLEVLIINDGSKDTSSEIGHEYENKYFSVFRVIDKPNGNYGSCINCGLKEAKGKYVKILDADDWFDIGALEEFMENLKSCNADVVLTNYKFVDYITQKKKIAKEYTFHPYQIYNAEKVMNCAEFKQMQMHTVTYRLQMLKDMDYFQTEGISYTDQEWIYYPMLHVKKIVCIPVFLYMYQLGREGQTMDLSVILKSINHNVLIIERMLLFNQMLREQDFARKEYLRYRFSQTVRNLYKIVLLMQNQKDFQSNCHILIELDNRIKTLDPIFYKEMDSFKIHPYFPIRFIRNWRKSRVQPSTLILLINKYLKKIQNSFS